LTRADLIERHYKPPSTITEQGCYIPIRVSICLGWQTVSDPVAHGCECRGQSRPYGLPVSYFRFPLHPVTYLHKAL